MLCELGSGTVVAETWSDGPSTVKRLEDAPQTMLGVLWARSWTSGSYTSDIKLRAGLLLTM